MKGFSKTGMASFLVLVVAAVAAALPAPASAGVEYARGTYGYVYPGTATCRSDGIHVDAPMIKPSIDVGMVGGSQWTALYSVLERWDSARGWVDVYTSEPYFHQAMWTSIAGDIDTLAFWYVHPTLGWRRTNQGQFIPMAGRSGSFRYSLVVVWFNAYNQVIGDRRVVGQGMADERGVDTRLWRYWNYCNY